MEVLAVIFIFASIVLAFMLMQSMSRAGVSAMRGDCRAAVEVIDGGYAVIVDDGRRKVRIKTFVDEDSSYALRCAEELADKVNEEI